jgi:homoserine/homoserine lactone efflux protein
MSFAHLIGFVIASVLLIAMPGPNVAVIVANSVAYGARYGLLTVVGTSTAGLAQLALTILGMSTALSLLGTGFAWLRWLGVAYLLYLGIRAWSAPAVDLAAARPQPKSRHSIVMRGFLVSLTNPKTLLFYGAFFPQFIDPAAPLSPAMQMLLLAVIYMGISISLDSVWALSAARLRRWLAARQRLQNRVTGAALMGAGVGLALARVP